MTITARAVRGDIELTAHNRHEATATVTIDPTEDVFAGHYPDFAIFPGVCAIELVIRTARQTLPEDGLVLSAIESTRFLRPIYPGDRLSIAVSWSPKGDGWTLRSEVSCGEDVAVRVRLRFQAGRTNGERS